MEIKDFYKNGENMLKKQEQLAEQYKYKLIPPLFAMMQHREYEENLPEIYKNDKWLNKPIYSLDGILLANKSQRVVIGDYGAFVEVLDEDIVKENLIIKQGQEYRINDDRYAKHVKYFWYCPKTGYPTKIYYQQKTVEYADYRVGCWYFSPYEIIIN